MFLSIRLAASSLILLGLHVIINDGADGKRIRF